MTDYKKIFSFSIKTNLFIYKMKRIFILLFAVFLVISCNDNNDSDPGIDIGKLHLSKAKPQPGETIHLRYQTDGKSEEKIETTLNYLLKDKMYSYDIDMKDSSGTLIGKIRIPDSIEAIAFNFNKNGRFETNNKKGYTIPLYNEKGQKVPGAMANIGTYYTSIGDQYDIEMPIDSAIAMVKKDLKNYPEIESDYEIEYSYLLLDNQPEEGKKYVKERFNYYLQKDSMQERDYKNLISFYKMQGNHSKSDSLRAAAIKSFPKGDMAKSEFMGKARNAKTSEEALEVLNEYNREIGTPGRQKDYILNSVSKAFLTEKKYDKFLEYASRMEDDLTRASLYNSVAWNLTEEEDGNLKTAQSISEKSLEAIKKEQQEKDDKPDYYTDKQYDRSLNSYLSSYKDTYAYIHFKRGDINEALKVQEEAVTKNSQPEINTRYVQYLMMNGKYEKAQEKAEKFLKENRAEDMMNEYLERAYEKNKGSKEGLHEYVASINAASRENIKNDLQKEILNEPAPAFKLKDLEGNDIALADLKGKTVILDFWATWCAPCKASFPGMKTAVEKFQDENVEFFFVDTFENQPTRNQDAKDFIKENDYPFHVLIDNLKKDNMNVYETADAYNINGIPTKIIIGPEGNIRFKIVGYGGNNAKMVDEIGIMIELSQQDDTPEA